MWLADLAPVAFGDFSVPLGQVCGVSGRRGADSLLGRQCKVYHGGGAHDVYRFDACGTSMNKALPQMMRLPNVHKSEVVEHYTAGMSSRRVAATLGLGRTTVLGILKAARVPLRPQGRKY